MKSQIILLSTIILAMGLFSFFKKNSNKDELIKANKVEAKPTETDILLGMVLLEEPNSMRIKGVVDELRNKWGLTVDDEGANDETSVLTIDNYTVAIAKIEMPIPGEEIQEAAMYNYYWVNGDVEAAKHKGHIIVSILNGGANPVKENLLFNKVVSSILNNSQSLGVYIGGRTLLLSKDFYQGNLEGVAEDNLPINNLVYFGIRQENNRNSIYTYGLKDFKKREMEVVNSKHNLDDLLEMMYNITHYVLASDVTLNDGETIGMSAEQKLKIKLSKGKYLEEETLKIEY